MTCHADQHKLSVVNFTCCGKIPEVQSHVQLDTKQHSETEQSSKSCMTAMSYCNVWDACMGSETNWSERVRPLLSWELQSPYAHPRRYTYVLWRQSGCLANLLRRPHEAEHQLLLTPLSSN